MISQTDPGVHGTCDVSGATVTQASGDARDSSLQNKDALINGVQVTIAAVNLASDGVTPEFKRRLYS